MDNQVIVTGGAGFIGSNFVLQWLSTEGTPVVNLDKLTYAGNLRNLHSVSADPRYQLVRGDIADRDAVRELFQRHRPRAIVHFAAESHVDRSIRAPDDFIRTNVNGTFKLLEEARAYWDALPEADKSRFRFLHVSTDEVYGSLGPEDSAFCETSRYEPNSPYSASKAASDHLVRAYYHTYPEKLMPLLILNAQQGKPLPVYGDGKNVRDWVYVTDHCEAVRTVLAHGQVGQTYNIGGRNEKPNIEVVETICSILDEVSPKDPVLPHRKLISYVKDRPGHDRRYAIDARKIERDLGWKPRETFETGLRKTVAWYLNNDAWVTEVTSGSYRQWIATHYAT
ncbi:MAG: dTDP-glucose 4,6-dehydratase [Acidobacteria bacterium]|nr:MAG: dTDP-glucose 4,6-dehydratase [Acidobacteriota bacterium]